MLVPSAWHYLDNAATTPLDPDVAAELSRDLREVWGNPSSLHPIGALAARKLAEARELLAGLAGASLIVFTGGGTEATNLAMRGSVRGGARAGKPPRVLIGAADHPSVLATAKDLEAQGIAVSIYPVDEVGRPRLEAFVEQLGPDLRFVSLLHGNNESGSLLPMATMVAAVRDRAPSAHVHVDAVQSFAKIPLDVDRLGVDSMTIAAHKFHGPKGVGALLLGPHRRPGAVITGGGQESGLRSGTENVCGNLAMARAAAAWIGRQAEESGRVQRLRDRVQNALIESIPDLHVLGDPQARLPHVLLVAIEGVAGEVVMHHLEEQRICVSTGSACAQKHRAKGKAASHVLAAMDLPEAWQKGTLRVSFGRFNGDEDADAIIDALPAIVRRLRDLGVG
jgi:cysteine desulfurase